VSSANSPSPRDEYTRRLEDRRRRHAFLARRERVLGFSRLGVFLAGVVVAFLAFYFQWFSAWWLAVPIAVFSALLIWHERVARAWYRAGRAVAFYERGLARLDDNWKGKGQPRTGFFEETHPYAADLDLFGPGSLFELLCTARTRTGEETLASWLKAAAAPGEIRARQEAVAELKSLLDLREDLALLGAGASGGVDFAAVVAWGEAPPILPHPWLRWVALALALATAGALGLWLLRFDDTSLTVFFVLALVEMSFAGGLYPQVKKVLHAVDKRAGDLSLLANVLERLERATFTSPRLRQLHEALYLPADPGGSRAPPSQRIARLGGLIDLLNSRRNQFFAPVALLLLWGTQLAFAIEAWRRRSGPRVARWLEVVGQFEALCAFASFAYENPDDPFPEIVEDEVCYDGDDLGHPLIPKRVCVANDLRLCGELRLIVVSGSNMSGKSTFLRTVGINAVLALAGATVRARRLRLSPLAIGATLRIQDSLQAGRSRFYAELLRVKQLVDLANGPLPLLFLLDELFAGTNSHDRRVGAEAVVCGLVQRGALGLITTHDLSLTHIAERLGPRATNCHFADHLEDGEMIFDYRMRPGVVRHSNALALMRAVGLDVAEEPCETRVTTGSDTGFRA
jgi:hypothetical protein